MTKHTTWQEKPDAFQIDQGGNAGTALTLCGAMLAQSAFGPPRLDAGAHACNHITTGRSRNGSWRRARQRRSSTRRDTPIRAS